MFFRIKTTRSGQALQLVESYRNQEGKPRQRIVIAPDWPDEMAAWLDFIVTRVEREGKWSPELKKLRERVETGGLKDPQKIQRAIGRTLQKNPRVARYSGANIAVCHNQT